MPPWKRHAGGMDVGSGRHVLGRLEDATELLWRSGGTVSSRGGSAARAWACPQGRTLVVSPDLRQASELASDRRALFPEGPTLLLKDPPLTPQGIQSRPLAIERGETLRRWASGPPGLLSATPGALMAPCRLGEDELLVERGQELSRERLLAWLERNGYQRSDLVWSPGQYVARGYIIDVFDPSRALPIRIETFDETVERIVSFHPSTQRTAGPDGTMPAELDAIPLRGLSGAEDASPTSLIPPDARIVLCDPHRTEGQALSFHWLWRELDAELPMPSPRPLPTWDETFALLARSPHIRLTDAVETADAELAIEGLPPFKGEAGEVARLCAGLVAGGTSVTVLTRDPRFLDAERGPLSGLGVEIVPGALSSGFVDMSARRAFLSDRELAGASSEGPSSDQRAPLEWRERLSPGQLVVHERYGVGVFRGIEEVSGAGPVRDALTIEFAQGQRLLVPVLQSHELTPLAAHESEGTQLDSLRGTRWRKSVERDRERAKEEAKALMEIFARRELERRPPWDEPGDLYDAFVQAFPHAETADQLRAVSEIMADLSGPFPMDRVLVGDVGFGKTEVALRAALRVVEGGGQVCVLVPTTILAQQHLATFRARLAGSPVSVGLLSRFVPRKELARTLERAADGTVDIVIGTHKLLQGGLRFKRLGLLVVDEEHRFGVMHKEGLKKTYGAVDILSLSATPIPRTLAMALRGLRSISVLSTPPEERLPVTTFAGPWQTSLARKAIAWELNRGGQVYFLSDRISRLEDRRRMLAALFPDARIAVAHGQMPERELEATMSAFYTGQVDILVATTIIESGLDVGRANTIIVDDAQELGLAQMYQLRGRVGRRGENAFAYFFYPEGELRRETADRLDAISTMTELGSGWAIARRDLDIRGGGEIGGVRQHGTTRAGGEHAFYRLLEQELPRLRGTETRATELTFDRGGSIPQSWIPQEAVRVTLYRRMLQVVGIDELRALSDEMGDRFGAPPEEARLLIALTAIKALGGRYGLEKVHVGRERTIVAGDLGELRPHLRDMGGWTALSRHAEGPGGLRGAQDSMDAMIEASRGTK
ncbi:MAG: DEAD/DEAH box helicase [Synergistaceae bacterium]|nr:DEAD/DEAH box helicase [Synergistaceae bacterium]